MRRLFLSALFCLFVSISTQAEPFFFLPNGELAFNTQYSTQGSFTCSLCTGSGTNSVVFGSGPNTLTLIVTGVSTTFITSSQPVKVITGQIQVIATGSGFVFPTPSNPNVPLITLNLGITTTSPTAGFQSISFTALGGGTSLIFSPFLTDHIAFPVGTIPPGFGFTHVVFTFNNLTVPNTNVMMDIPAQLVAVPEPTSLLLLGSGVGMMLTMLRRRFSKS
jgi:hypothetical protein